MTFKFSKLVQKQENLFSNFWLIPLIIVLFVIILALGTIYCDYEFSPKVLTNYFDYKNGQETAMSLLSIIATSAITVTSVVFSITVLILSIVSNQHGSRILSSFLSKKNIQFIIGFFISTFIFAILVLQSMSLRTYSDQVNIPYISIYTCLIFGIITFFLLIYFIHFVWYIIQIDNILEFLRNDITDCIEREFKLKDKDKSLGSKKDIKQHLNDMRRLDIQIDKHGYIQTIDYDRLRSIAEKNNVVIKVHVCTGDFMLKCVNAISCYFHDNQPESNIIKKCNDCIMLGNKRSTVQDIEFAFEQISEIAIRALSPGINNPYTAVHCINIISEGIYMLEQRQIPDKNIFDSQGKLIMVRNSVDYTKIVRTIFNRLRQQAQLDLAVTIHILSMIGKILTDRDSIDSNLKSALLHQAELIYGDINKKDLNKSDLNDLKVVYQLCKD